MSQQTYVYIHHLDSPIFVGSLWTYAKQGRESAVFEYAKSWLSNPDRFALEPALTLVDGPHHIAGKKSLFGAIGDSAPDRWGRMLMRRAERMRANALSQTPRSLFEIDYLLNVNDEVRQGALRFKTSHEQAFSAYSNKSSIPPYLRLPELLGASDRVINESADDDDIRILLAPGSSLGGARPKAAIRDKDGSLSIAKFSSQLDEYNIIQFEALAFKLAKRAGITVPISRIENINQHTVHIIRRFDRNSNNRIPFLSAMSMLGANDNEARSYLEIADAISQYGASIQADLEQLFRRLTFNILISNTDDHLRNHGFLYEHPMGWRLSPAYDLNPTPIDLKPRILSTYIDFHDGSASIELALSVAQYFGLSLITAKAIIKEIASITQKWRTEAKKMGVSNTDLSRIESAFEHDELTIALKY